MEKPVRKQNRLTEYNYGTPGAYFITICTDKRRNLFWENVGAVIGRLKDVSLTDCGKIVCDSIQKISDYYPAVSVDKFVVMPNHIHLLLQILADDDGRPMTAPTIPMVVNQLKGSVSKKAGFSVWQKGFYDHVVRNERDYLEIWKYIDGNPGKWAEDRLNSCQ